MIFFGDEGDLLFFRGIFLLDFWQVVGYVMGKSADLDGLFLRFDLREVEENFG